MQTKFVGAAKICRHWMIKDYWIKDKFEDLTFLWFLPKTNLLGLEQTVKGCR